MPVEGVLDEQEGADPEDHIGFGVRLGADEVADDIDTETGADSADSDKPAGPKHRAPLNGTKKTTAGNRTDSTDADSSSAAGDSDAGDSDQKSDKASDNNSSS